jgi:hypothetical protein
MIFRRLGGLGHINTAHSKLALATPYSTTIPSSSRRTRQLYKLGSEYQLTFSRWGYLQTGSGYPPDILPIISRTIDIPYNTRVCVDAFNITTPADVDAINKYGGFNLSYPRLAFIDGEWDPWRAATPHAIGLPERPNTIDEPFWLIPQAVHHWDENGLFPNETTAELPPASIKEIQSYEVQFVTEWLKEWKAEKCTTSGLN